MAELGAASCVEPLTAEDTVAVSTMCGSQNRIVHNVSQGYFGFTNQRPSVLGAALAHSRHPLVDFLSLAKTWPSIHTAARAALLTLAETSATRHFPILGLRS